MENLLLILSVLALALLVWMAMQLRKNTVNPKEDIKEILRLEFNQHREELAKNFRENRIEFTQSIERLTESLLKKAKEDRDNNA